VLSRPDSGWKSVRDGSRGGARQSRHQRTNWYHPFLWTHIDTAARKLAWSPHAIANHLIRDHPQLFARISKGTIQRWIDKDTKCDWSVATQKNIERRHALAGSGQTGILAKYPAVVKEIQTQLQALRTSGLSVNVLIARSVMLAIIQQRHPELLKSFKCSEVSLSNTFMHTLLTTNSVICTVIFRERHELDSAQKYSSGCSSSIGCGGERGGMFFSTSLLHEVE
jgi:hypothetical protein